MSAPLSVPLWQPPADARGTTRLGSFMDFCEARSGRSFNDYESLRQWSIGEGLEEFWAAVWEFFDVESSAPYERVVSGDEMPGARWFEGARLNYARQALRASIDRPDDIAIAAVSQTRERIELTWAELADQVGRARFGLQRLGVVAGDRVAAYLPNIPETVVTFLAAASLGATFTSCAPEFGVQAVLDRFAQVTPTVLIGVEGYRYGTRTVSRLAELGEIRDGLPGLRHTVVVAYPDQPTLAGALSWDELIAEPGPLDFVHVAPDHPLYVLYSSGTTGLPKPIMHGHGGMLIEHLKVIGLHSDMGADSRFFWFTTTGWMMWNYLMAGLLVGARLVLFDGDPNYDGPMTLWKLAADERITFFGVSSPYISSCRRQGLEPGAELDLSSLRAVGATGAPLPGDGFRWIYEAVSPNVLLSPASGGTDVCSAFVGGNPLTPVFEGEIPARYLGVAVEAFDEQGRSIVGEQGELVITRPMPSMPVGFWGDADGSRYRAAYFEHFPGVWRHGDWVTISERGGCTISGRSDATLNRGGVRVGTAEIYRVVEAVPGVVDSLVVHLEAPDPADSGELVLFVVLEADAVLDEPSRMRIATALRSGLSPRHVPDEIIQLASIPTTLSGKKLELPVKKILFGGVPSEVASRGALKDPAALDQVAEIARTRTTVKR